MTDDYYASGIPKPMQFDENPVIKFGMGRIETKRGTRYYVVGVREDGRVKKGPRAETKPEAMYRWNKAVKNANRLGAIKGTISEKLHRSDTSDEEVSDLEDESVEEYDEEEGRRPWRGR